RRLNETAFARLQVAGASLLKLEKAPDTSGTIAVRLTDANGLRYAGATIVALTSAGGDVHPGTAATGADGIATFQWSPGALAVNQLNLYVEGLPAVALTISAGSAVPAIAAVANAASFEAGIA